MIAKTLNPALAQARRALQSGSDDLCRTALNRLIRENDGSHLAEQAIASLEDFLAAEAA